MSELTDAKEPSNEGRFQKLTKIDAARRQLVTAIRLYFLEEDEVSIHTLTAASLEVLRDLLRRGGGQSFIKDGITFFLEPDDKGKYLGSVRVPQNFLKHADRDPDGTWEFSPNLAEIWIFDCVKMYRDLTGAMFEEGNLFNIWFALSHPESLRSDKYPIVFEKTVTSFEPTKEFFRELLDRDDLDWLPKVEFRIADEK